MDRTFVSNEAGKTAQTAAKRARPRQRHMLYAKAVIPRTTKFVTTTKNNITLNTPTIDLKSHNAIHQTSSNNNQQTLDLRIKPKHRP